MGNGLFSVLVTSFSLKFVLADGLYLRLEGKREGFFLCETNTLKLEPFQQQGGFTVLVEGGFL